MNYFETYAPVVTWFAIRLMITFGIIFCWALDKWTLFGLSTSSNQDGHLYGAATRDSNQAWELQRTCFEAREEYLWPETGLAHVEFIPLGQTHIHRIHNIANK